VYGIIAASGAIFLGRVGANEEIVTAGQGRRTTPSECTLNWRAVAKATGSSGAILERNPPELGNWPVDPIPIQGR